MSLDNNMSHLSGEKVKTTNTSGVHTPHVNVDGFSPGTGATSLGKAEDAAHTTGDVGVMALAVRADTPTATGANGDYVPLLTDATGRVHANAIASDETSTIFNGTTALTPKFAVIDVASSGDNTILAAVTGKKIRVLALFLVSAGTVTTRFESGASGTALTGQMNLVANSGFCLPYNPVGWFETASNTLLNLELSGAVSVDGSLVYVEV